VVGEEPATLEDVYEPFLIQEGFLKRTARGREGHVLAYRHLGYEPPRTVADRVAAQPELPLPYLSAALGAVLSTYGSHTMRLEDLDYELPPI
jgi:hypothetical protein